MEIKIGVSARHVHLTKETLENLFGEGYELTKFKDLSQPNQYASNEKIDVKTEKGEFKGVRILGPIRYYDQVELSKTDAFKLGINPPVRSSGDIKDSEEVTLVGPKGEVTIKEGCIIANRHIHVTEKDIEKYDLPEVVSVKVDGEKGGILENVRIKKADDAYFELHIDTDDANAHLINNGATGKIVK